MKQYDHLKIRESLCFSMVNGTFCCAMQPFSARLMMEMQGYFKQPSSMPSRKLGKKESRCKVGGITIKMSEKI